MMPASYFFRGNTGNMGNIVYPCGFPTFPRPIMVREHGEQNSDLFPLFPRFPGMRERRKAFIHAVVPPVPSVPPEKQGVRIKSGGLR